MTNIYKKISLVMNDISFIAKKEKNKEKGMLYDFISHDDVTLLVRKPMILHGIVAIPSVLEYTIVDNKHSVKVEVTFANVDDPTDNLKAIAYGFALDNQDKGYGKAISYALKYLYLKVFLLQSGEADEVDAYQGETETTLSSTQIAQIEDLLLEVPELRSPFMRWIGVKKIKDIKASDFNKACYSLKLKIAEAEKLKIAEADEVDAYQGETEITLSPAQIDEIEDLISKVPESRSAFMKWIGVENIKDIKVSDFNKACSTLKSKATKGS